MTRPRWWYAWSDPLDRWGGIDKVAHFFGAAFVWTYGDALGRSFLFRVIATAIAIVVVEVVEAWRWERLGGVRQVQVLHGALPWPWMADRVSLKDILAGAAGAAAAAIALLAGRLLQAVA